jgi:hypothetical protein
MQVQKTSNHKYKYNRKHEYYLKEYSIVCGSDNFCFSARGNRLKTES